MSGQSVYFLNKKDNSGFSLIEVLVVLAITAIILSMAGITMGIVNNANVSKAATRFEAMINRSRSESIAKGTDAGRLVITCENGKVYGQIGAGDKELICNKQITVYAGDVDSGGADPYSETSIYMTGTGLSNGDSIVVEFTPAGVVKRNDSGLNICKLLFKRGNRQVEVVLYRQTGKHLTRTF